IAVTVIHRGCVAIARIPVLLAYLAQLLVHLLEHGERAKDVLRRQAIEPVDARVPCHVRGFSAVHGSLLNALSSASAASSAMLATLSCRPFAYVSAISRHLSTSAMTAKRRRVSSCSEARRRRTSASKARRCFCTSLRRCPWRSISRSHETYRSARCSGDICAQPGQSSGFIDSLS